MNIQEVSEGKAGADYEHRYVPPLLSTEERRGKRRKGKGGWRFSLPPTCVPPSSPSPHFHCCRAPLRHAVHPQYCSHALYCCTTKIHISDYTWRHRHLARPPHLGRPKQILTARFALHRSTSAAPDRGHPEVHWIGGGVTPQPVNAHTTRILTQNRELLFSIVRGLRA